MEKYFKMVEEVLTKYPIAWQKNYYQNKMDLVVQYEKRVMKSSCASYNHEKNEITLTNNKDSLLHELFHMSFRDKSKIGQEVESGIFIGNGVSLVNCQKEKIKLYGITEGFAEYLNRKTKQHLNGNDIEYFFVDLFITIYGEEILEYPLCNNPIGLITDDRFYNLYRFTKGIDAYCSCVKELQIIHHFKTIVKQLMKEEKNAREDILEHIENVWKIYNESILDMFQAIIEEYLVYNGKHSVEQNAFIKKLSSFLTNLDYEIAFLFDDKEQTLKKTLYSCIELVK